MLPIFSQLISTLSKLGELNVSCVANFQSINFNFIQINFLKCELNVSCVANFEWNKFNVIQTIWMKLNVSRVANFPSINFRHYPNDFNRIHSFLKNVMNVSCVANSHPISLDCWNWLCKWVLTFFVLEDIGVLLDDEETAIAVVLPAQQSNKQNPDEFICIISFIFIWIFDGLNMGPGYGICG